MQLAVHFVVSLAIGALLLRDSRRPVAYALAMGALGVLPDIDHVWNPAGFADSWLHSGYPLVLAPLMLLVGAFVFDNAAPERRCNTMAFALAALSVLSGHIALDMAAGNALPLAYPIETGMFRADGAVLLDADGTTVLCAGDVVLVCWVVFVALAYAIASWRTGAEAGEALAEWEPRAAAALERPPRPLPFSTPRRLPV